MWPPGAHPCVSGSLPEQGNWCEPRRLCSWCPLQNHRVKGMVSQPRTCQRWERTQRKVQSLWQSCTPTLISCYIHLLFHDAYLEIGKCYREDVGGKWERWLPCEHHCQSAQNATGLKRSHADILGGLQFWAFNRTVMSKYKPVLPLALEALLSPFHVRCLLHS